MEVCEIVVSVVEGVVEMEVPLLTLWTVVIEICDDVVRLSVDGIVMDEDMDCRVDVLIAVFEVAIWVDVRIEVGVSMVAVSVGAVSVWSVDGGGCVD